MQWSIGQIISTDAHLAGHLLGAEKNCTRKNHDDQVFDDGLDSGVVPFLLNGVGAGNQCRLLLVLVVFDRLIDCSLVILGNKSIHTFILYYK